MTTNRPVELREVADELYGLPLADFMPVRNDRARQARDVGHRDLAASIGKLRKPTKGAWLANLLVRHRRDDIDQLLSLGASLRQAQSQLAGEELRRLSVRRRQVVVALARQAEALAREEGETVSEAAQRELEETLEAALADTDAAEALASGRLTAALHYAGLGGTDVSGAVALPAARRATGKAPASTREPSASVRDAAKDRVAIAQRDLAAAQEAAGSAEGAFREATQTREGISERVQQLERELATTREREERTAQRAGEAEQARDAARRVLHRSLEALREAQADLDRLDQRDGDVGPTSGS